MPQIRSRFVLNPACSVLGLLALLTISTGCGPSSAESELIGWAEGVRTGQNADDLRTATLPLFKDYAKYPVELSVKDLPDEVLSLNTEKPTSAWIEKADGPDSRTLWVWWRGGFGHYGIAITPFGGTPATNGMSGMFIQWEKGILFWNE